jgi:TPP-dependent pyruvate/acetoin dehydrogenase alpha subunit
MELSIEKMADMLYKMYCARIFERRLEDLFSAGEIKGSTHLGIGQEGCAVGVVAGIEKDDLMMSNHRGHCHCIAKGADLGRMMAEMMGKATGFCKGMGGSLHVVDIEGGNYGANGIVGAAIPISTGIAFAVKREGSPKVVVDFFGDGASNSGTFHESLNMAALWNLPIIYVCENNQYAMSTPTEKAVSVPDIADRAAGYGIPGKVVDGNDVLEVMNNVKKAAKRAREGKGPMLLELKTYRWSGHSRNDDLIYRTREEEDEWKTKDPIKRFKEFMMAQGFDKLRAKELKRKAELAVEHAVEYARNSPLPTLEQARGLVFSGEVGC